MAARIVLLDLDGTLWDSRPWYAAVLGGLGGGDVQDLERRLACGTTVASLARECSVGKSRFAREAAERTSSLPVYETVRETLHELRDSGVAMGVVTNLPGWLATPVIRETGVGTYFEVVVTPGAGVRAKPKPHGIRRALRDMIKEVDADTWFVGDGTVDAEAARSAGVRFAWAAYGYEAEEPVGTDRVVTRFEQVLEL